MKKVSAMLLGSVLSLALVPAHAAQTNVFKMNGEFAQLPYSSSDQGWVTGSVGVDGNGASRVAYLFYAVYTPANGYAFWRDQIPLSAVTVKGVSSMAVELDTCTVSNTAGCGYVKFEVNTNEPASGWINKGSWGYAYDGYMVRFAGAGQARSSSATGSILGLPVDGSGAWIGTLDNVTVEVTVGK